MSTALSTGNGRRDTAPAGVGGSVLATVDLGTNNCRLLVARPTGSTFQVVDSFSRVTRLGEGLAESGRLSEPAMVRAVDALKHCAEKMARRQILAGRHVATEACRRASNGGDFIERVRASTGIVLEIISPAEEARLALAGCAALLDPAVPDAVVFDIGGGSTEVTTVGMMHGQPRAGAFLSLPVGVVSLAERQGASLSAEAFEAAVGWVRQRLDPFAARQGAGLGAPQLLGTSGTVTTLGAIHLGLERYDRMAVDGLTVPVAAVRGVIGRLLAMSVAERLAHPCIGHERADLVLAGCAILEAILRVWPAPMLRIADRGLREGVLMELVAAAAPRRQRR